MANELDAEMGLHLADPFPDSIVKGEDYGEVNAVLIGVDIWGWALRARDSTLSDLDRPRLLQASEELGRSIDAFPPDAQPYYLRILRIAELALAQ